MPALTGSINILRTGAHDNDQWRLSRENDKLPLLTCGRSNVETAVVIYGNIHEQVERVRNPVVSQGEVREDLLENLMTDLSSSTSR